MSEQQSQTTAIEQASRLGDSVPTPERQAELRAAYSWNSVHGGTSTCVYTAKISLVSFAGRPAYYC